MTQETIEVFLQLLVLAIAFQFKHLIADYYLQYPYMYLNKGKPGITNWVRPLFDHSLVHAVFTYAIISYFLIAIFGYTDLTLIIAASAALFDLVTHFITDRWKAAKNGKPDTEIFWITLGWDQLIHHTVGVIIIFGTVWYAHNL